MRLTDAATLDFVCAAADAGTDAYFYPDDRLAAEPLAEFAAALGGALILLPGPAYASALCANADKAPDATFPLFADVRLLRNDAFCAEMRERGIRRLILPFAECAFLSEYGYRASYREIGELRASGFPLTVAALFSAPGPNDDRLCEIVGGEAVLVREKPVRRFPAARFDSDSERDRFAAAFCRKQFLKRTVVFFPTRDLADSFASAARGFSCRLFHGGLSAEEKRASLSLFLKGEIQTLAATKHLLPSAIFFTADRVVYAGLPYSLAHACRCATLSLQAELTVLYTASDLRRSEMLSLQFARALEAQRETFLRFRTEKQAALLQALDE